MTVDPTVPLSSLAIGTTFMIDGAYGAVLDPAGLPPENPGQIWNVNLESLGVGQSPGTLAVIPVPLKVVHA